MSDKDYLGWPFFDDSHRQLAMEVENWAENTLEKLPMDHTDIDSECKLLVRELGKAGFLANAVPAAYGGNTDKLEVRRLCITRETLGRYSGWQILPLPCRAWAVAPCPCLAVKSFANATCHGSHAGKRSLLSLCPNPTRALM